MKTVEIVFSPTGGTQKVVDIIANKWGNEIIKIDLSDPDEKFDQCHIDKDDNVIIAMPSFGGRAVKVAIDRLGKINGNNARCTIVCVYGNRAYEDALLEMQNLVKDKGFIVIGAAAFIANHSIMTEVAVNRPDDKDKEKIKDFAAAVKEKIKNIEDIKNIEYLQLPGDYPYRKYNGIPLKPTGDSKCTACGACVQNCPVNAIPKENPRKTDKTKCITCMGCAAICPQGARHLNKILHYLSEIPFKKKYGARKEPDIFV